MTKEDFIKKYASGSLEFIADLDSIMKIYMGEDDEDNDEYDWDKGMDDEDRKEAEWEERCELAATCRCGAWQFNSKGDPVHVADCCCGVE